MKKILFSLKITYALLIIIIAFITCTNAVGLSVFTFIAFGFYASLATMIVFLTRRIALSLVITSSLLIILQLLNQIKVHYYKERLFFSDFYVAFDPKNFSTLLHYPSASLYLFALLIFLIANIWLFRTEKKISQLSRWGSLLISIILFCGIVYVSKQAHVNRLWQQYLPKGRGTIANLFISSNQFTYEPPIFGNSSAYFLDKLSTFQPSISAATPVLTKKPDVVVFLQESTVNPQLFDIPSSNVPSYEMFSQPNSNLMRVQTFGGGTWLTEFSMLTGLNTNDFSYRKNSVYYVVAPHIQTSLFKEFNDNGYFTVVLSPMGYGNYNAGPAYTSFGMQKFFMPQDLGYAAEQNENLWKIPTQDLLDRVKMILDTYTDKPLFIFVLSMNEHGPYDPNFVDETQIESSVTDKQFVGRFNDYLSRITPLDSATQDFSRYIQHRQNPTLFLYFGDHQPALSWGGDYKTKLSAADYLTQYTLTTNYPSSVEHNELTDVSLVSGLILEKTGVQYSDFYRANIAMRYLCDGKLDDCEDKQLVESYKHYIYQDLQDAGQLIQH
ncbi:phosphoglycerol transferase MdoB-like AlkP superfamily enzyme [Orbus hercynius]|uniref:Phosphoglycerol transferase MdoB-like AlkP superfamily enzyme n=1 Tax=Orbus hercynius TaxID=593135 RepID=A0A495RHF1_9GAMM|nr:sulfatase-like hydrolase/transferase [Orbus hercynius]RKS86957.1 phosphoglycerol transferase MdoB-like AlkP superfamily enzyme [Orbus hercynius]